MLCLHINGFLIKVFYVFLVIDSLDGYNLNKFTLKRFIVILRGGLKRNSCAEASLRANIFTPTWINRGLSVCFTISLCWPLPQPRQRLFCAPSLGGARPQAATKHLGGTKNSVCNNDWWDGEKSKSIFACSLPKSVDPCQQTDQWIKPLAAPLVQFLQTTSEAEVSPAWAAQSKTIRVAVSFSTALLAAQSDWSSNPSPSLHPSIPPGRQSQAHPVVIRLAKSSRVQHGGKVTKCSQ